MKFTALLRRGRGCRRLSSRLLNAQSMWPQNRGSSVFKNTASYASSFMLLYIAKQHKEMPSVMQRWIAREISRGATTFLVHMLSLFTRAGLPCSLIDTDGSFDCIKAEAKGMTLERVLWVRCKQNQEWTGRRSRDCAQKNKESTDRNSRHDKTDSHHWKKIQQNNQLCPAQTSRSQRLTSLEQAFKAADILLHAGGFALIAVDIRNIDEAELCKVPLTTWFRFARIANETQTELIFLASTPTAYSCTGLRLHINGGSVLWTSNETDHNESYRTARSVSITKNRDSSHFWELPKSSASHLRNIDSIRHKIQQSSMNISSVQNNAAARSTYPCHITVLHALRPEFEIMRDKKSVQHVRIQSIKAPVWK